jgi:hypothetical protein
METNNEPELSGPDLLQFFVSVDVSVRSVLNPIVVPLEDIQGNDAERGLVRGLEVNARCKSGLESSNQFFNI